LIYPFTLLAEPCRNLTEATGIKGLEVTISLPSLLLCFRLDLDDGTSALAIIPYGLLLFMEEDLFTDGRYRRSVLGEVNGL